MNRLLMLSLLLIYFSALIAQNNEFLTGADISYTNEIEENGGYWSNAEGNAVDPYDYFASRGADVLRLRLFHTPENILSSCGEPISASNLEYVLNASARIVNSGAQLMLTLHYGDYFNYPAEQQRPLAWKGLSHNILLDSIYNYTYMVLEKLYKQNTTPYIIGIGNETTWGFVDPWEEYDDKEKTDGWEWPEDAEKFNTAFTAVDNFNEEYSQSVKKALHLIDETVEWNISEFTNHGVTNYDIIGYSFYPGFSPDVTIEEIGQQINKLVNDYPGKEVMILETGWHWTDDNADDYGNFLDWSNVIDYPRTEQGQLDYLLDLKATVKANGASGLLYWEPTWITSGMCDKWGQGSSYEDITFFDFNNNNSALPAFKFFKMNLNTVDTQLENTVTIVSENCKKQISVPVHISSWQLYNTQGQMIAYGVTDNDQDIDINGKGWSGLHIIRLINDEINFFASEKICF